MPVALWCVLMTMVSPTVCVGIAKVKDSRYDSHNPRAWFTRQIGIVSRTTAAQRDRFETFPLFAVAVLVVILGGGIIDRISLLAIAFIVVRILYTVCYLTNWAPLRSLMWLTDFALCVAPFMQPTFAH